MQAGERGDDMTLKAQWYRDRLVKNARKGFYGYPVARIAFHGPDDTLLDYQHIDSAS